MVYQHTNAGNIDTTAILDFAPDVISCGLKAKYILGGLPYGIMTDANEEIQTGTTDATGVSNPTLPEESKPNFWTKLPVASRIGILSTIVIVGAAVSVCIPHIRF